MFTKGIMLNPNVENALRLTYNKLEKQGVILTLEKLKAYYNLFRARFGPEILASLDGEKLLNTIHGREAEKSSLVYWLEFKNDAEFNTLKFGSIKGGNSLKFGIAKKIETGDWLAGSAKNPRILTVDEAINIARRHRDQLLAAVTAIQELPTDADDRAYLALQKRVNEVAPDVSDVAWGHKYLYLLFPEKLDDYHVDIYRCQRSLKTSQ